MYRFVWYIDLEHGKNIISYNFINPNHSIYAVEAFPLSHKPPPKKETKTQNSKAAESGAQNSNDPQNTVQPQQGKAVQSKFGAQSKNSPFGTTPNGKPTLGTTQGKPALGTTPGKPALGTTPGKPALGTTPGKPAFSFGKK